MQQLLEPENNIIIHQAFYGEVNRSHGCITSSLQNDDLKAALTAFTDRPGAIPAGLTLSPYYSGSRFGNYYAFTLTFSDLEASRSGMVFTHVLLIKMQDLEDLNNLESLFGHFVNEIPDKKTELRDLVFNRKALKIKISKTNFPLYIQHTVDKLVSANLPVLFCGSSEAFKIVIASVWQGLPLAFRKKFAYTAGYSNTNIDTTKTIVYFQKNLLSILSNIPHIIDEDNEQIEIINPIEKYLLQSDSNNAFEAFLKALEADPADWDTLKNCATAFQTYLKINQQIDAGELKLLIRNLAKINPDPNSGKVIKTEVLNKFCGYLQSEQEENILSLRNLPLENLDKGIHKISSLIEENISNVFQSENFSTIQLSKLVQTAITNDQTRYNWWSDAIKSSIKTVCCSKESTVVSNVWKLLLDTEDTQTFVLDNIPIKEEETLIENLPIEMLTTMALSLVKKIKKRKWFLLHAHILLKSSDINTAILQQIEFEEANSTVFDKGTKLILQKIKDEDLLALVLEHPKNRLIEEYATRSITNPALLASLDVTKAVWLELWNASLEKTKDILHGTKDIQEKVYQILDQIINDENIPENIISLIAESDYADISSYTHRSELWNKLSHIVKPHFLSATANSYLEKLSNSGINTILEPELNNYISNDEFMTAFLRKNQNNITIVISAYEYISGLKDHFLADYIKYYTVPISPIDESRLGSLILSKQFSQSARSVFEKVKNIGKLKTTLAVCKSLVILGFWDLILHGHLLGKDIPLSSIYDGFQELAISLYPQGPEEKNIWKRSGGDISKFHNNKTREENWRYAFGLLKNGGGGKHISTKSLINQMLEDYPNNNQLKELYKYV